MVLKLISGQLNVSELNSDTVNDVLILVPVWSGANVAGVNLQKLNPEIGTDADKEQWKQVHKAVVDRWVMRLAVRSRTRWDMFFVTLDNS